MNALDTAVQCRSQMGRLCTPSVVVLFLVCGISFAQDQPQLPPRFTVEVPTVLVRVTVTDPLNRYVVGLEKQHFKLYEDKVEQTISHFSNDKAPISVGIILDTSGSMGDNILSARTSVARFLDQGDPSDEYFLVGFNERSTLLQDFTSESDSLRNDISVTTPKGRTALFDAIYLGLEKMGQARNDKKALIVITDGEDNTSRYTYLRDWRAWRTRIWASDHQRHRATHRWPCILSTQFQTAGLLRGFDSHGTAQPVRAGIRASRPQFPRRMAKAPGEAGSSGRSSQIVRAGT